MNKSMQWLLVGLLVGALAGCGGKKEEEASVPPPAAAPEPPKETLATDIQNTAMGLTGINTIPQGRKAKEEIKAIQEDYNRKMEQALDENQ